MNSSIFLSQLIGTLFIILAFSLIINTKSFKNMIKDFGKDFLLVYISGLISYIIGFLIIYFHNFWEPSPLIIITICGYLAFLKGFFLLLFPNLLIYFLKKIKISTNLIKTFGILYLILGLYLTYLGFFI